MTEIEQKPDNSARPLLPGWRLWLRLFFMAGESGGLYYGPAFPACPECGSPNVRLLVRRRRKQGDRYQCLEWNCKNRRGPAEVTGST